MEFWEIIASITAFVAILIAAIVIHTLNRWRRWGVVESDSIRRTTTFVPAGDTPALEFVRYEYTHGQGPKDIPSIVLLAPAGKYFRILDQYAVGLCLAEFPVAILKWDKDRNGQSVNFANIASKVVALTDPPRSGVFFLIYRSLTREIVPSVACAAKNQENRWILLSPEILEVGKWEIFTGNGANIYVVYSLDSPKKMMRKIQDLITKLQIPEQNVAAFPLGGVNLVGQETVALGKIISWISSKS